MKKWEKAAKAAVEMDTLILRYKDAPGWEKTNAENGLMLSPLFDKLFDRGFITFNENGDIKISDWLSPANQQRINFNYIKEDLHLTDRRKSCLEYHRSNVFK